MIAIPSHKKALAEEFSQQQSMTTSARDVL